MLVCYRRTIALLKRIEKQEYHNMLPNYYFRRIYDRNEIDFAEDVVGKSNGYEIKWGDKTPRPPQSWRGCWLLGYK